MNNCLDVFCTNFNGSGCYCEVFDYEPECGCYCHESNDFRNCHRRCCDEPGVSGASDQETETPKTVR